MNFGVADFLQKSQRIANSTFGTTARSFIAVLRRVQVDTLRPSQGPKTALDHFRGIFIVPV